MKKCLIAALKRKMHAIEELIQEYRPEDLKNHANDFLKVNPPDDYLKLSGNKSFRNTNVKIDIINEWLRFIIGSSPLAIYKWEFLSNPRYENPIKRDDYIINFIENLTKKKVGKPGTTFSDYVDKNWGPWAYYQNHFFNWFLSRYHIRYARQIFTKKFLIKFSHFIFFFVMLAAVSICYISHQKIPHIRSYTLIAIFTAIPVCCIAGQKKIGWKYFIQSLIPRLAATTAIGYFFLLSVPGFVRDIYGNRIPSRHQIIGAIVLLLFSFIFILLNIQKRVKPDLSLPGLLGRTSEMILIALSYGLLELLIFERILFFNIKDQLSSSILTPCFPQLFFITSIVLTIGIIFQLVWEEKPFTEPL